MKSKATLAILITLFSVLLNSCTGNIPITGKNTPPPTVIAEEESVLEAATSPPIEEPSSEVTGVSLSTEVPACQTPTASIKTDDAYLREGPDIRFSGGAQYKKGDQFTILGRYKDWLRVEAPNGSKGWFYKEWLALPSNIDTNTLCSIPAEELPPTPQTSQKPPQSNEECVPTYYVSCP